MLAELKKLKEEKEYTCGSTIAEIFDDATIAVNLHNRKNLDCRSPMEKAYYSANFRDLCYYCGAAEDLVEIGVAEYPLCEMCARTTKPCKRPAKVGQGVQKKPAGSARAK